MRWRELLSEGKVEVLNIFDLEVRVFENPNRDQVWNLTMETARRQGRVSLRGLSVMDGSDVRVYLWDAWTATHGDVIYELFNDNLYASLFSIDGGTIDTLSLSGDHYPENNPLVSKAAAIVREAIAYRNSLP